MQGRVRNIVRKLRVQCQNSFGYSNLINIFLLLFSVHALVTIQYVDFLSPVKIAKIGQDVTLPCTVKAFPIPNMAWKKDGELVTNDSRHVITRTALKILQVSTGDMGRYYCVAWNRGSVQAKSVLLFISGTNSI